MKLQLDRRVTIERKWVTQDDYGAEVASWVTFAERLPAQVRDELPRQAETSTQGLRVATQRVGVRLRYCPGVTSAMRLVVHSPGELTNRLLQITVGPAEVGRRQWLDMVCEQYSTEVAP